jgi:F0F1-type ATP synthase membrane subunit b/b'
VKRLLQRSALFGLTLALGVGLPLRQTIVRAQAAGVASASPAQAADAEKKPPQQDETDAYRKSPHVVEWGAKLGLNPGQSFIAFDVANFLLLVAAAGWVLMKTGVPFLQIGPVPQILRDRSAAIQKHLVDARTATEEARARLSGVEARLAKLDDEIAAMRAHAEQDSAGEEQRIKASVEDEKRKNPDRGGTRDQRGDYACPEAVAAACGGAGDRTGGPQAGGFRPRRTGCWCRVSPSG